MTDGTRPNGAPSPNVPTPEIRADIGEPTVTKRFWTRSKMIASGALAVVAAVTGVISIIPILTRDPSNVSHLEMSATTTESATTDWVIPGSLLLDDESMETFSQAVGSTGGAGRGLSPGSKQTRRKCSGTRTSRFAPPPKRDRCSP